MRGAVNQFLSFQKPTIYIQKPVIWMKLLLCESNSSGTNSPFMMTDCLGNLFKGNNIARQWV